MTPTIRQRTKDLLASIPAGLESAIILRDALFDLPENLRPGKALKSWIRELERHVPSTGARHEKSVLLFCYLPQWLDVSLAIGVVLAGRQNHVDFVYLPYARHESEDLPSNTKHAKMNYWKFMTSDHPNLRFINLMQVEPAEETPLILQDAEAQALLDTKYIQKREEIDIVHSNADKSTFEFRYRRNLSCMKRISTLIRQNAYDALVVPNGISMEFGAVFRIARQMGQETKAYEFGEQLGAISVTSNKPVPELDTSKEWNDDLPHVLSPDARQKIGELISIRRSTNWKGFLENTQKAASEPDRQKLLAKLGIIEDGRPIVLMCPSTTWDSAVLGNDPIFPSSAEWARRNVNYFSARQDAWLVIRAHPLENYYGCGQTIHSIITENKTSLPAHIRYVGPKELINTYDLMDICDFGLVYSSTTGLEFAVRGIAPVVGSQPHYARKGFTVDVGSIDDYYPTIDRLLATEEGRRLTPRQMELAWCYMYVFYFKFQKRFPWSLGSFWKTLEEWSMSRVLSLEGQEKFGSTFDLLAGG